MGKITVEIEMSDLVPILRDDGGYYSGRCLLCNEGGWSNGPDCIANLGTALPLGPRNMTNQLIHKPDCPVGVWISNERAPKP